MSNVRTLFESLGLSRWQIVNERIKSGGQAAVLAVTDNTGQKGVFRCLLDPDKVAIERFHRELRILTDARFQHPNIVEILDHTREPSDHWYISRFGDSFNACWNVIRSANDDPVGLVRKAADIVSKLADGLGPLHREGVVHRDIKPRNIVMRTDAATEPVLIDFGIAHVVASERLTDTNVAVGNRRYSPDVSMHRADSVPPWIDIFQLAQLLIWMLQTPAADAWDRPLDWRYVNYDDRLPDNLVVSIRGVTARCCEESLSPKDGGEMAALLRQRIFSDTPEAVSSVGIDITRIQKAMSHGESLRDIAAAEDTRAVQAEATVIAPLCLEIVDGLHRLVKSAAELGLKVNPGTTKKLSEIIDIAQHPGGGMYHANFQGAHGNLAIYCNLDVRLPSARRRWMRKTGQKPKTTSVVRIQCTRVADRLPAEAARIERHLTLESDGTLMLRDKAYDPIGPVNVGDVVEMFKGWIEDPEVWAALHQDR